ncbi:copine-3-like [Porites lutea]|uniref:copine-3-like n=1 Tax=Porites lutea TaxID=51062 RepID=UPI003CC6C38B
MQAPYPSYPPPSTPSLSQCVTRVELNISCRNLRDKDVMSKSDPMAVVMILKDGNWLEVGRTERLDNTLNPRFSKAVLVDYFFEELQKLKFFMYDIDSPTGNLKTADFLGELECTLGQLVSSGTYTKPLVLKGTSNSAHAGAITVVAEEVAGGSDEVYLQFRAEKLDKKDFLGKSDPFLELARSKEDGTFVVVHRTEVVENNLNPRWKAFQIPVQQICNGDYDRTIQISCFDWDSDGSHDLIGSFTTNLREMCSVQPPREVQWPCINIKKQKKKKGYKNSGLVSVSRCEVIKVSSFLDYIQGGCQLNFTVGIDFTASNGDPTKSTSLHYINPYAPNEYTQALMAVGEIIQDYDSDKLFPAFGFGARIPPSYQVSHQFPLNFNPSNPYCAGLPGLVQAYQSCIQSVQLYGPTNISPIINHVAHFAQQAAQTPTASNYFILLILTDGVITDMDQTRQAVVAASGLPMSIIIVGVGGADFKMMEELDSDEGVLRAGGRSAQRDIVQFVPFRKFKNSSPAALAKEVLAEVPKQLTEFFRARNILPQQRPT